MNKKGFSLIELLIVIVIIGIIVIIAVPSLLSSKRASQESAAKATLRNISSAQVAYMSRSSSNDAADSFATLHGGGYLDARFNDAAPEFGGYVYSMAAASGLFTVTATPTDPEMNTFQIDHTLVLMDETGAPLS